MKSKTHILILLLFVGLTFLSCNSKKKKSSKKKTINIATLKGPSAISMIKLIDDSKEINGLKTNFIIKDEPLQVRKMLINEAVDFAVLPTTMAAIMYNKGINYKLAAIPLWGTLYLCGKDSTIHEWSDLQGKRINLMAKGMTPDVLFKYLLAKNNLKINKDVKLDYSFPTHIELASAIAAEKANIGVISEPFVSIITNKNKNINIIFDLDKEWKKATNNNILLAQTALLVNSDFADNFPELTNAFLQEYKETSDWVNHNQTLATDLIVKHKILLDTSIANTSINNSNIKFEYAYEIKEEINKYLNIFYLMNKKIIGGKIPDEDFYYKK
ncbi:MAG: ABC transporter substrate-binding protein [Bacteroidales bacterium]|jgi:NitT/TauT family transport system substrate-binding protein|nr:ABC transporter substrate-binding protein [Bacteroidales bacterium]